MTMNTTDDNWLTKILEGDCRKTLKMIEPGTVQTCVTSPPYWGLRHYGDEANQIGQEESLKRYLAQLVKVFTLVHKALRPDGTLWLNMGDTYVSSGAIRETRDANKVKEQHGRIYQRKLLRGAKAGVITKEGLKRTASVVKIPPKNLLGIPWRVAFALQASGWILRQDVIWSKPNPIPEPVRDRCTKSHEYVFLFVKRRHYHFDASAIAEKPTEDYRKRVDQINRQIEKEGKISGYRSLRLLTANKRSVWTIKPARSDGEHNAVFPLELAETCILAGSTAGGIVLDPFAGSGTTGEAAVKLGRRAILCEISPTFLKKIKKRVNITPGLGL